MSSKGIDKMEKLKPTVDQMKVLSNASRLQIISLLFDGEKTISQLSDEIGITVQTVHHHIHVLLDAGLIHVDREETEGNIVKRYYAVEENVLDSSQIWRELTPKERKKYKLAALGIIKGMVNRGIKYIQKSKDIDQRVGWVIYEKIPMNERNMEQVVSILTEAQTRLDELKAEGDEEEITILISTLPG